MKVEVVSRVFVKPCTPTPPGLRSYKISAIDELSPPIHVIRILYYQPPADSVTEKLQLSLKESLAQVLPAFYPLAGRYLKEKRMVDCNDEGAEYVEAQVDCELHHLMGQPNVKSKQLNNLLPLDVRVTDEPTDPILAVQVNRFSCGGLAIGICASHRIFDSCSLGIFLAAWANAACGDFLIHPDFDSPSFFPAENVSPMDLGVSRTGHFSVIARRFVFDKNAISKLRDSVGLGWGAISERQPSRVVVVSAFLAQALLRADRAKYGRPRASIFAQAINVRERTVPPIPKHACGSWVTNSCLEYSTPEESHSIASNYPEMVSGMRKTTTQGVKDCARIFSDKEFGRWLLIDVNFDIENKVNALDYKMAWITDWTKFGEYELDFGFGKPVWVSLADVPVQDLFILMSTKENDGIEAWVYLHESDMPYFEEDEALRMLTSQY